MPQRNITLNLVDVVPFESGPCGVNCDAVVEVWDLFRIVEYTNEDYTITAWLLNRPTLYIGIATHHCKTFTTSTDRRGLGTVRQGPFSRALG